MKYKLINNKTKEETICEKVEIDGFDYYVNNDKITSYYYNPATNNIHIESNPKRLEVVNKHKRLKIIATNNPNIDIPKVIEEIDLAFNYYNSNEQYKVSDSFHYTNDYNKAKETYQFTEEDMVEFSNFVRRHYMLKLLPKKSYQELLSIWKEQQIKTIYYE